MEKQLEILYDIVKMQGEQLLKIGETMQETITEVRTSNGIMKTMLDNFTTEMKEVKTDVNKLKDDSLLMQERHTVCQQEKQSCTKQTPTTVFWQSKAGQRLVVILASILAVLVCAAVGVNVLEYFEKVKP